MSAVMVEAQFPFSMLEGHVVFETATRQVLLDTGSPHTYSRCGDFTIDQRSVAASPMPQPVAELLDRHVPAPIDALLGMDFMSQWRVSLVSLAGYLMFADSTTTPDDPEAGTGLEMWLPFGLPVIEVTTGSPQRVLFDTGAPLSYLRGPWLRSLGPRNDFYIGVGAFETQVGVTELRMADRVAAFENGEAPPALDQLLRAGHGFDGILGSQLLTIADVVIDARRNRFLVRWHSDERADAQS